MLDFGFPALLQAEAPAWGRVALWGVAGVAGGLGLGWLYMRSLAASLKPAQDGTPPSVGGVLGGFALRLLLAGGVLALLGWLGKAPALLGAGLGFAVMHAVSAARARPGAGGAGDGRRT
jgi:hypothetical protein